jgi:Methyltransferase domain
VDRPPRQPRLGLTRRPPMQLETDPDAAWVETLTGASASAASRAIVEAQGERRLFQHLVREHASEGRESYIEIDAPLELHALVRLLRPTHVVEVGVSSGVSSAYLLNALERNGLGTLHSVDLPRPPRVAGDPKARARASWSIPAGRSSGWAVPFPLRKRWDLRLGDKAVVLPLLAREIPRIDLLVYDVPHDDDRTRVEFGWLDPRSHRGTVAIADHGPEGGLCEALRDWAKSRSSVPVRREGLGLYGARLGRRRSPAG